MKKLMWKSFLVALCIPILFSNCLLGIYRDPDKIGDWYSDIEVGAKYTIRESFVDINGNFLDSPENPKTTVRTVMSVEYVNGVTEVELMNEDGEDFYWVVDENDDVIYESSIGGIYLAAPIEVGTSWDVQSDDWDNPDVSEIITVGGVEEFEIGELDDIIVITTSSQGGVVTMNRNSYYSPSVGMDVYSVSRYHMDGAEPSNDEFHIIEIISID